MIRIHRTSLAVVLAAAFIAPSLGSAQPAKAPAPGAPPPASAAPSVSASTAPTASEAPSEQPAPSASAAPLSTSEEAGRLFQEGREAFKADRFEEALALFQKSHALEPTPGVLLNIALTEEKLGKPAAALRHFERVTELLQAGDDRLPIARDGVARTTLSAPRLRISRAAGTPPTLAITLDGQPLAANLVGAEQPIEPGKHVITTRVHGFEERTYEVTLAEGQRLPIAVEPGKRVLVAPPPNTAVSSRAASPQRMAVLALGGAGVAALGVGLVTGILAVAKQGELASVCPDPASCSTPQGRFALGEARTFADVSTGTLVFGGAALAAGALVFFTTGAGAFSLSASAGPGATALTASGRF